MSSAKDIQKVARDAKRAGWKRTEWRTVDGEIALAALGCPYCDGDHIFKSQSGVLSAKGLHHVV